MRRNAGVDADGCVVVVAKGTSFKPKVGGWPRQARWREAQHLCSSVLSDVWEGHLASSRGQRGLVARKSTLARECRQHRAVGGQKGNSRTRRWRPVHTLQRPSHTFSKAVVDAFPSHRRPGPLESTSTRNGVEAGATNRLDTARSASDPATER
jgi:hypothetical protein